MPILQIISMVWGLIAVAAMAVTFTPHLAWVNYYIIPFGVIGLVPAVLAVRKSKAFRSFPITGIVLCATAILYGIARFAVGFGAL